MDRGERRHLAPKIETTQPLSCLGRPWVARVVGSFRPIPHPECQSMRLCSLLSQPCQGDHVLVFWVCSLPNISSRVSRSEFIAVDIHPSDHNPRQTTASRKSPVGETGEGTERKARQGLCLREHLPIGRLVHAEMLTSAHAARWISQAGWGSSATPASPSHRRRNRFDTSARRSQPELKSFRP